MTYCLSIEKIAIKMEMKISTFHFAKDILSVMDALRKINICHALYIPRTTPAHINQIFISKTFELFH